MTNGMFSPNSPGSGHGGEQALLQALDKIRDIVSSIVGGPTAREHSHDGGDVAGACSGPKSLPDRLLVRAAETARKINPVNEPAYYRKSASRLGFVATPERISALTSKYWGAKPRHLSVSFVEQTSPELKQRILQHMNAWTKTGCISFAATSGLGQVRISRGQGGYWSYMGTDILHIPTGRQTMNLEGFTMNTPESEYRRVIRHETGHTLGFPHEHMRKAIIGRIDTNKIYDYALQSFGWDKKTVDEQILTPLDERDLIVGSTAADQLSIMCYQLPGSVTKDGKPIIGGSDIDQNDYDFCGLIYPRVQPHHDPVSTQKGPPTEEWGPEEDVELDLD
jgi:hypothetical protein